MRLTNGIASATEAAIGGRDGAASGDGSYDAGDGSYAVGARDKESATGLDEGISTAIAVCLVDALDRDRGLALAECLRHTSSRLKGIIPSSRYPLRFLSIMNPLSQASLKHCMNCSHFRAHVANSVCLSVLIQLGEQVFYFYTLFCLELLEIYSVLAL